MKPYILDLREEGCPMALLLAKKKAAQLGDRELMIQIRDISSIKDIVRYFETHGFLVQTENIQQYYLITVYKKRRPSNA